MGISFFTRRSWIVVFGLFFVFSLSAFSYEEESAGQSIFDPNFEGIYSAKIECREEPASKDCLEMQMEVQMVIMNVGRATAAPFGVLVSLAHPKYGFAIYEFSATNIYNSGATFSANSTSAGIRNGEISLEITQGTTDKKVLAYIRDPEFQADLKITGTQIASPGMLYHPVSTTAVLSPQNVQAKYDVSTTHNKGTLSVRLTLSGMPQFFATYVMDVGAKVYFDSGEFLPEMGILNLVDSQSRLKWTLAIERTDQGILNVRGIGFSGSAGVGQTITGTQK